MIGAWSEDEATGDRLRLIFAGDFSRFDGDFVPRDADFRRTGESSFLGGDFDTDFLSLTGDFVFGRGEMRFGGLLTGDLDDRLSLLLELESELEEDEEEGDRFLLMERFGIELLRLVDFRCLEGDLLLLDADVSRLVERFLLIVRLRLVDFTR